MSPLNPPGSVLGLCLLNEPWTTTVGGPITLEEVASWAQTAVDAVLAAGWKGHIWFPDGFNPTSPVWQGKFKPPQYQVKKQRVRSRGMSR
jgi:hypothetical protein